MDWKEFDRRLKAGVYPKILRVNLPADPAEDDEYEYGGDGSKEDTDNQKRTVGRKW